MEKLHRKSIKAGMEISGSETVKLQIYGTCDETYIDSKLCMIIIHKGICTTTIDNQDEPLLRLSQSRHHRSAIEDKSYAHGGNQRMRDSEINIPLKHNGKDVCAHRKNATNLERESLPIAQLDRSTRINLP